jgi:predicted DNA-binding transcriptional regulator AlpA
MQKVLSDRGVQRFVGRAEVAEALSVSVKTLDRMVADGRFPRPVRLSPNRVGWAVETVNGHLLSRIEGVTKLAVTDPDKLAPDELEDKARELAAAALSQRAGKLVDASALSLHLTQQLTAGEFVELEREEHRTRAAGLAQLPGLDAAVVAAALLPSLTPVLAQGLPELQAMLDDPDGLRVPFRHATDFLRLLELAARLSDEGMRVPANTSVLEHLAGFDSGRAMLVAARLFPSIRAIVAPKSEADRQIFEDDDLFEAFAMDALDDTRWPEAEARLLAGQESCQE